MGDTIIIILASIGAGFIVYLACKSFFKILHEIEYIYTTLYYKKFHFNNSNNFIPLLTTNRVLLEARDFKELAIRAKWINENVNGSMTIEHRTTNEELVIYFSKVDDCMAYKLMFMGQE